MLRPSRQAAVLLCISTLVSLQMPHGRASAITTSSRVAKSTGLDLSRDYIADVCNKSRGSSRTETFNSTYLNHCARYKLDSLLSNEALMSVMHREPGDCRRILKEFIKLDENISKFDRLFTNLLTRYNCHNGYSVKWNCEDCERAYKDWLCAVHLPVYMGGERVRPCISFCERVEQRCPYLHPITKEQYGGQPVFICRDPNIPFVPTITPDIPYSEPNKCYDLCHLTEDIRELEADTLSKYPYDFCPQPVQIALEVRKEYCQLEPNRCNPELSMQNKMQTQIQEEALDYPEWPIPAVAGGSS